MIVLLKVSTASLIVSTFVAVFHGGKYSGPLGVIIGVLVFWAFLLIEMTRQIELVSANLTP